MPITPRVLRQILAAAETCSSIPGYTAPRPLLLPGLAHWLCPGGQECPQSRLHHATWIENQMYDPQAMSLAPPSLSGLLPTVRMSVPASRGHQPSPGLPVPGLVDAWPPSSAREEEVSLSPHKGP